MQFFTPFITSKKHRLTRIVMVGVLLAALVVLLAQTALAQITYVITDGDHVTYHTSFSSDPAVVLDEAGVELDSDDFYTTVFFTSSGMKLMPDIIMTPKSLDTDFAAGDLYISAIRNTCGLLVMAPLIVVYLFGQRFLVQGIERSGIVG